MSRSDASLLAAALVRLRRRFVLARVGDAAGVGLAAGAMTAAIACRLGAEAAVPAVLAGVAAVALAWRSPPSLAEIASWLDRRHGLADLLGSAWGVRHRDEPWAALLRAAAATAVAGLPPPGRLGRLTIRHHACVVAGAIALLLTSGLTAPTGRTGPTQATLVARRQVDEPVHTARVVRRAADSAVGETPAPTAHDSAAARGVSPRPAGTGADGRGTGRADVDGMGSLAPPAAVSTADASAGGGGSGRGGAIGGGRSNGRVAIDSTPPRGPALAGGASIAGDAATAAVAAPAAYRELVQDYFAR